MLTTDGVIIRVDPITGAKSTLASGGLLQDTAGITATEWGQIYVMQSTDTIVHVSPTTGEQNIVSQGGFLNSFDITADRNGNLFAFSGWRNFPPRNAHAQAPSLSFSMWIPLPGRSPSRLAESIVSVRTRAPPASSRSSICRSSLKRHRTASHWASWTTSSGGGFGGFVIVNAMGTGHFQNGPWLPTEFAFAPNGDLMIRAAADFGRGPRQIEIWDSSLFTLKGVLPTPRDYLIFGFT